MTEHTNAMLVARSINAASFTTCMCSDKRASHQALAGSQNPAQARLPLRCNLYAPWTPPFRTPAGLRALLTKSKCENEKAVDRGELLVVPTASIDQLTRGRSAADAPFNTAAYLPSY
jgi:hypothetical protein